MDSCDRTRSSGGFADVEEAQQVSETVSVVNLHITRFQKCNR